MSEKQNMIEDFLNQIGFRERIVIGMYDNERVYFHVDFSQELANGLMTVAFMDKSIHHGIKELVANLETILKEVGRYRPTEADKIH